jgi:SPP1 gp7 family putative phage head morphogenesis protein
MKDFQAWNPDILVRNKGIQTYGTMMADDQVKAVTLFKRGAVSSRKWFFDVDEDNPDDVFKNEYFMETIDQMQGTMEDIMNNILTDMQYGFSVNEIVLKTIDIDNRNYWGLKDVKLRPAATIDFNADPHGNTTEIIQNAGSNEIIIPIDKVIKSVNRKDVDPVFGESDLRAAYSPYWRKDIVNKFWAIHLERHAGGFTVATVPAGYKGGRLTKLQNILDRITAMTGVLLPEGVKMENISPNSTDAFEKAIASYDKAIAKSMLVPNLLGITEQGNTGSFAQSKTQFTAFLWVLDQIAARLVETLNEQLWKRLCVLNFATTDFPRFQLAPMSNEQIMELMKVWSEMVSKNAVTKSDSDEAFIRKTLGFPEKPEEEEPEPVDDMPDEDTPDPDEPTEIEIRNKEFVSKFGDEFAHEASHHFEHKPWLSRVDFQRVEDDMDENEKQLIADLGDALAEEHQRIDKLVTKMAGASGSFTGVKPKEAQEFTVSTKTKTALNKAFRAALRPAFDQGSKEAARELPEGEEFKRVDFVGATGNLSKIAESITQSKAFTATRNMTGTIEGIVRNAMENGINFNASTAQVQQTIAENAAEILPRYDLAGNAINQVARVKTISRTETTRAINNGRQAFFQDPALQGLVQAFEYSAILDGSTSDICESNNGKIQKDFGDRVPPNHFNCRSILVAVTVVDDWDGKQIPGVKAGEPAKGFGIK